MIYEIIPILVEKYPEIVPHLKGRARWVLHSITKAEYKSYDFFLVAIERMVRNVYNNLLGGDFIDVMANLISGQITDAYERAWLDTGGEYPLPPYLIIAIQKDVLKQYDYVDQYYRDIVDARIDKTPVEPLLSRAALWANKWNKSYNNAMLLIQSQEGGNLVWRLGATEKHCSTCKTLDGVVASAAEWEASPYKPQGSNLECGGWRCDCSLEDTEQRRSRNRKEKLGI